MMRQHQFYKVELVSIVEPKKCLVELDRMLNCAEVILKKLEVPYQVVLLSTGDMGLVQKKLLILKYGFHLKRSTEKSQAVLRADLFNLEGWEPNLSLKMAVILSAL